MEKAEAPQRDRANKISPGETLTRKANGEGAWPSQKGSWNPEKGSWGKGGKGANGLEDEWSGQGYWQNGQESTLIFWMGEETSPRKTPKRKEDLHMGSPPRRAVTVSK